MERKRNTLTRGEREHAIRVVERLERLVEDELATPISSALENS